jgi:hypothetical protein
LAQSKNQKVPFRDLGAIGIRAKIKKVPFIGFRGNWHRAKIKKSPLGDLGAIGIEQKSKKSPLGDLGAKKNFDYTVPTLNTVQYICSVKSINAVKYGYR